MSISADDVIARLRLEPHPEGGWFRQDWSAPVGDGRPLATAIWFMLRDGERSHWHRIDADELWLWHAGADLALSRAASEHGPREELRLGPGLASGALPRLHVPKRWWQAARSCGSWALVSCVVVPGFMFDGFELAPPGFDIPAVPQT